MTFFLKGCLLFSSVELVKLVHVPQLRCSSKMSHFLAPYSFEGLFRFVCALFLQKEPLSTFRPQYLLLQNILFWRLVWFKIHPNPVKPFLEKKVNFFSNTLIILVWKSINDYAAQHNSSSQQCVQKVHIGVKHLNPCFLTTSVQNKY